MSALDITENDMFDATNGKDESGNGSNGSTNNDKPGAKIEQPSNNGVATAANGNTPAAPEQPQTGTKKASDKQINLIKGIISDISKGYAAVGQNAQPEAITKRMKDALKLDKDLADFLVADASKAIDYLTDIKVKIPKPQSA